MACCDERFWVFVGIKFVVAACGGIPLSKTADPHVLSSARGMLTLLLSRLCSCIEGFGFMEVIRDTSFDYVLSYLAFCRAQEVDWSVMDLEGPFSHTI